MSTSHRFDADHLGRAEFGALRDTPIARILRRESGGETESLDDRDEFAIFEDEHRRYACETKARICLWVLVNVQFSHLVTSL